MGEENYPPTPPLMIIDTERLESQLKTARDAVATFRAYREAMPSDALDALDALETTDPLLDALLSACADLEWVLTD
jgi:hypothetical protein